MSVYTEYVWLHRLDCTHEQIENASDKQGNSYLIAWDRLSAKQKQEFILGKP